MINVALMPATNTPTCSCSSELLAGRSSPSLEASCRAWDSDLRCRTELQIGERMGGQEVQFPFGRPVIPVDEDHRGSRRVFVLGAYPSALHVSWASPDGQQRIKALPVDNEPEPFWTGFDQAARIDQWKRDVGFDADQDGTATAAGGLNGSSGLALDRDYLQPLGIERDDARITDCLPTYHASVDVANAIEERFKPVMSHFSRPMPQLPDHPSEDEIVASATQSSRLGELRTEIAAASPEVVISLGNAAARVLRKMLDVELGPERLNAKGYGDVIDLRPEHQIVWYPLAHPGVTRAGPWSDRHDGWVSTIREGRTP